MRIDKYLFEKGLTKSRSYALTLIKDRQVLCNGSPVTKASLEVGDTDRITIIGDTLHYVSRGGLKLEGVLQRFALSVSGMICVDIGSSTGGFTDCLLQNGAKKVYAIDSGSDQLHPKLKDDPRVISMESTNVRFLNERSLPEKCDLAVCDVSFISQTLLHPNIAYLLKDGAYFITLIKPQFECGKKALNKKGIIKDPADHQTACNRVTSSACANGFSLLQLIDSPIEGGDGNHEFLAVFQYHRFT